MSNKTLGVILIVVGILIVIAVLALGFTGFTSLGVSLGFGWKKILLALFGVIVTIIGAYIHNRVNKPQNE
jgi:DMSO/TMAO reductase YedYZ heme-binding membrane subunit